MGCATNPSHREQVIKQMPDGKQITCYKPPPDVVATHSINTSAGLDAKTEKITAALKGEIKYEEKLEKLRAIADNLQTVETMHFRICIEYSNGILTELEYKEFLRALPILRESVPKQSTYIKREAIPPFGVWEEPDLGFRVRVSAIGNICNDLCTSQLKAFVEITTSTYTMPDYAAVVGFSTSFRHNGKTYKLLIEDITYNPPAMVATIEEIAYKFQ